MIIAPVSAVEQVIKLGAGVSIDGYMLRVGELWEFRYGLEYASSLMGYSENYYGRLTDLRPTKKPSKKLKSLLDKGYTGYKIPVRVPRYGKRGVSVVETISFDDLCYIIELEAEQGNPKALALLTASFRELLRSRTQQAFGLPEDTLEQKQEDFQYSYEAYLEREEMFAELREEVEALRLPGDEDLDYDMMEGHSYYPYDLDDDDEDISFW